MGEEGTAYSFIPSGESPSIGGFSEATRGHIQGYDFAARASLSDGYTVEANCALGASLYGPDGAFVTDQVGVAIDMGLVTILSDEAFSATL